MLGIVLLLYRLRIRVHEARGRELALRVDDAVAQIKVLKGMLPICASCHKIRDDRGYWTQVEEYMMKHSEVRFSHGICPDCIRSLYPDLAATPGLLDAPPGTDS